MSTDQGRCGLSNPHEGVQLRLYLAEQPTQRRRFSGYRRPAGSAFAMKENVGQLMGSYDYSSIMHYRKSVNRDTNFVRDPKIGAFEVISGYDGIVGGTDLSRTDIATVNARY